MKLVCYYNDEVITQSKDEFDFITSSRIELTYYIIKCMKNNEDDLYWVDILNELLDVNSIYELIIFLDNNELPFKIINWV